jgi:hypothetical protein
MGDRGIGGEILLEWEHGVKVLIWHKIWAS